MERNSVEPITETKELIFVPSELAKNNAELSPETVEHSTNAVYRKRSTQLQKDCLGGEFEAK